MALARRVSSSGPRRHGYDHGPVPSDRESRKRAVRCHGRGGVQRRLAKPGRSLAQTRPLIIRRLAALAAAAIWLTGCSPHAFFYYPNNNLYVEPHHLNLSYEELWFPSANKKMLFGLLFRTKQEPKGIVVQF